MLFITQLNLLFGVAALLLAQIPDVQGFWRLPCRGRTGLLRIDPLVSPGEIGHHVHALHGGSNLNEFSTSADMRESNCTSCAVKQDKSAYWTPAMYFMYENGTTTVVPQVGGVLVYYLLLGQNITAFPDDFSMVIGDTWNRNFTGPIPDRPKSHWTAEDKTQHSLGLKALGFNCMNYGAPPEGTLYRHFMPDKEYLDAHCRHGIRAEIMMPSCWNGKQADDHRSHVAYPDLVIGGNCPSGFDIRLPSIMYETIWDTYFFHGQKGRFVFANGDPTGNGYHADFLNGWEPGLLQKAIDTCTSETGEIHRCPLFDLQSQEEMDKCRVETPEALLDEDAHGSPDGIPGNVPVMEGPGYAYPHHSSHGGGYSTSAVSSSQTSTISSAASQTTTSSSSAYTSSAPQTTSAPSSSSSSYHPSLGYAPGTNFITDNHGGVITVAAVTKTVIAQNTAVSSPSYYVSISAPKWTAATPATGPSGAPAPSSSSASSTVSVHKAANIAPVMPTPVPISQGETQKAGETISTETIQDGPTVKHVIVEMVMETTTVDNTVPPVYTTTTTTLNSDAVATSAPVSVSIASAKVKARRYRRRHSHGWH